MSKFRPILWQKALDALRTKDRDIFPPTFASKPEELIIEIEEYSSQSKGKPIKLPNGENLFVRDVLEKVSRWVKKFVEVGDVAVQYDPGHASLPWAAIRLILQMTMNNLDTHAAVLEGIEKISYYLVWSKVEETSLAAPYEAHAQLESDFIKLYTVILTFMARCIRFLRSKSHRIAAAFFSSDSKFNDDISKMASTKLSIESCTRQISNTISHSQYAELVKVRDQLAELEKPVIRVERAIQSATAILDRSENQRILNWASEIPFQKHFQVVEEKALSGTGAWLFQDANFSTWHNCSRSQILWLHGSSGSGKSTLISLIIRSLIDAHKQHQSPYPIYFFCSRNTAESERADPENILRSLMRQASDLPGGPTLHSKLKERYNQRRTAGEISPKEATDIIIDTIEDRPLTYIMIDALDECDPQKRDTLIDSLKTILTRSTSLVKIFITSRENHQDITWSMEGFPALCIDASRNQADINRYVQYSVKNAIERRKLLPTETVDKDLQQRIEDSLCNGAAGMFRWVELQLKFLYTLRKRSILLDRLDKLPPVLEKIYEDLYEHNIKELGEDQAEVVRKILAWLLIAKRPLHTSEICQLVCAPEESDMSNDTVLDMCFDLVRLDVGQEQFRFSHLSVREFLENRPSEFAKMSLHVMATCACLSLVTRRVAPKAESYAAIYWPFHAEDATKNGGGQTIERPLNAFFTTHDEGFLEWSEGILRKLEQISIWKRSGIEQRLSKVLVKDAGRIFVTACFGLPVHLERAIADSAQPINLKNIERENALYLASEYGHAHIVQILLDKGADTNAEGGFYGNALQAASCEGHAEIVRLLLENGASVNAEGGKYGNALQAASYTGDAEIVRLLLKNGASVNAEGGEYGNALHAVSCEGHAEIVRLLLENGASVNAQGGFYGNALQAASCEGNANIVRLMLKNGASVNAEGGFYGNALHAASCEGHAEIVRLLLENGASVNAEGGKYGNALQAASYTGDAEIVRLLLDNGASVNAEGGSYGNALHAASCEGHAEIVRLLLENGASVNAEGGDYGNALQAASFAGDSDIVRLLLENGASVNAEGGDYGNALQAASFEGHAKIVRLLLQNGASVNAKGGEYGNALQAASSVGNANIVRLLLENGASINVEGGGKADF